MAHLTTLALASNGMGRRIVSGVFAGATACALVSLVQAAPGPRAPIPREPGALARTLVDMHAPEAARAVVAVLRAVRLPDDVRFAVDASERLAFRVLRFGIHEKKRAIRTAGNGRYSFTASMNMNSPGTR